MNIDKILALVQRMEDFEKRDLFLLNYNKVMYKSLAQQNEKVNNLFKGYILLGIVEPDNGGLVVASPITREMFFSSWTQLEEENNTRLKQLNEPINNLEYRDIVEDFIIKMFDLTAARWESIVEYMQLWRGRRMESRNQSIGLMEEYTASKKGIEDLGNIDSEANYNEFLDILAFQEKHLVNEESIMKEIQEIFKLREKLIEMAVEAFKI